MRLHLGRQQALIVQDYETMAVIVGQAFGGKSSSANATERTVTSIEGMESAMKDIFGG